MNTETGEIEFFNKMPEELRKKFVEIKEDQMTDKQKREMRVSKFDNKSELGKLFTGHRKLTRKQKNRIKNKQNIS